MTHHHWEIQTKPDEDGIRDSLRQSPHCTQRLQHCACVILPLASLSRMRALGRALAHSREGRSIPHQVRLQCRTVDQYAGFWRLAQTSVVASRVKERNAAAKMTRAVLFISVFTIFLDVLHAGQVRKIFVLKDFYVFC